MKDWKLIRSEMDNQRIELYDLKNDIHEDENPSNVHPGLFKECLATWKMLTTPTQTGQHLGRRNN